MTTALGEFLRAQRERLRPDDVGLAPAGRRRTPGLRREEVAALAGLSVDYYRRLEQGRGRNPTPAVLDALVRALDLSPEVRGHLHRLAQRGTPGAAAIAAVDPATHALLETFDRAPALVVDPTYAVLAANAVAEAVFGRVENLLVFVLTSGVIRPLGDGPTMAAALVAGLRARHADAEPDPALIAHLRTIPEFRRLWAQHRVDEPRRGRCRVGAVEAEYAILALPECGQRLISFLAPPGSAARAAFARSGRRREYQPAAEAAGGEALVR